MKFACGFTFDSLHQYVSRHASNLGRVPCWIELIVTHVFLKAPSGRSSSVNTLREGRAEGVGGLEQATAVVPYMS